MLSAVGLSDIDCPLWAKIPAHRSTLLRFNKSRRFLNDHQSTLVAIGIAAMSELGQSRRYGDVRCWRKANVGHKADARKVPATDIPRARPTVARCFLRGTKPGWSEDAGLCYHLAIVDLVRSL